MEYVPRLVDEKLEAMLRRAGAVLIQGPKACGKTETARRVAASQVNLDTDSDINLIMETEPKLILEGEYPRLIDEWQLYPVVWNLIRRDIDESRALGRFLLTGSTAPSTDARRHSGAGRFARLNMKTMSFLETGHSTGEVSLAKIVESGQVAPRLSKLQLTELLERMVHGGWPGMREMDLAEAQEAVYEYAESIADTEIPHLAKRVDRPAMMSLLLSLSRNIATEVKDSTLSADIAVDRRVIADYMDRLRDLFIVVEQPAWPAHLRSKAQLRKKPKLHLADPSLAVAMLRATPDRLLREPEFAGQLFESQVVHDLSVYTRETIFHARDNVGAAVDAVIDFPDGTVLLIEIKLGYSEDVIKQATSSLDRFAGKANRDRILKLIITGGGMARTTREGVMVVPLSMLGP